MISTRAFWLAGRPASGETTLAVSSPWTGQLIGEVSIPTDEQVEEAVAAAYAVRDEFAATPAYARAAALDHLSKRLAERSEAHLCGEREADQMGSRRGRPCGVRVPVRRGGSPPL